MNYQTAKRSRNKVIMCWTKKFKVHLHHEMNVLLLPRLDLSVAAKLKTEQIKSHRKEGNKSHFNFLN